MQLQRFKVWACHLGLCCWLCFFLLLLLCRFAVPGTACAGAGALALRWHAFGEEGASYLYECSEKLVLEMLQGTELELWEAFGIIVFGRSVGYCGEGPLILCQAWPSILSTPYLGCVHT